MQRRHLRHTLKSGSITLSSKEWYANIRTVNLLDDYPIGHGADENLLHGIHKFGQNHDNAFIHACVLNWKSD